MHKNKWKTGCVLFFLMIGTFTACDQNSPFNQEEAIEQILRLHNSQRAYHFDKDSIAFANQLSDSFISVNRGQIKIPEKEATIARYHNYFSSVEFVRWDDLREPIIKFSDDGSLAYTVVDKIVEVAYKDVKGNTSRDSTHFAWIAIYKKYGDEWKIDCVASTNT